LKLLTREEVGDMNKRNCLGYLPCENLHVHPIMNIPKELESHFIETLQEMQESDYMIITSTSETNSGKKDLIIA